MSLSPKEHISLLKDAWNLSNSEQTFDRDFLQKFVIAHAQPDYISKPTIKSKQTFENIQSFRCVSGKVCLIPAIDIFEPIDKHRSITMYHPITGGPIESALRTDPEGYYNLMFAVRSNLPIKGEFVYDSKNGKLIGEVLYIVSQNADNSFLVVFKNRPGKIRETIFAKNIAVRFDDSAFPDDLRNMDSVSSITIWTTNQ